MGDKNDSELLKVKEHLRRMKDFKNIRVENEKVYQLKMIYDSDIENYIEPYFSSDGESQVDFDQDGVTDNGKAMVTD